MRRSEPLSVLLVEDNPADARFVREMLRDEGGGAQSVEVTHASRLREALAYLQSQDFSAVLLDLTLPDSDGIETFERARAEAPTAPIVVLTGMADEALAARAVRHGAQDYLVKGRVNGQSLYQSIRYAVERYAVTDRLQRSEQRYRTLVEGSIQGILIQVDDVVRFANRAAADMLGVEPGDLVGRRFTSFVDPADRPTIDRYVRTRLAGEPGSPHCELRARRDDGTRVWLDCIMTPIPWDGEAAVLATLVDLTELRRTEDQLQQAQKMEAIGRLAGGIAHDFNNLLSAVLGLAELVLSDLGPEHPSAPDVQRIQQAAQSATSLTQQLLAFSRRQILQPQVLDPNAVVRQVEPLLRRVIGERIQLSLQLADDADAIRADPGQLEQIVMNLSVNARDAMTEGGRLTIQTSNVELDDVAVALHPGVAPGPYVLLSFTDTGLGMDEATQQRLFEPFFTTKEIGKGTGLGLATVYGIVRQSRGFIYVYSEPGLGSTFKVYFPAVQDEVPAASVRRAAPAPVGGTETVLLVEDQPELRMVAAEILRRHGYTVLDAGDGDDALRVASQTTGAIDLLLTDVVMPGLGGREVAATLTSERPTLKVLFTSGYADDAMLRQGIVEGELNFIQKPFSASSLLRKLREVLDAPQ